MSRMTAITTMMPGMTIAATMMPLVSIERSIPRFGSATRRLAWGMRLDCLEEGRPPGKGSG